MDTPTTTTTTYIIPRPRILEIFNDPDIVKEFGLDPEHANLAEEMVSTLASARRSAPSIFPSWAGIRLEWFENKWDISVDVDFKAQTAYFHAFDHEALFGLERSLAMSMPLLSKEIGVLVSSLW